VKAMSDFAKAREAQRQTIKDQAAEITRLRAELATAQKYRDAIDDLRSSRWNDPVRDHETPLRAVQRLLNSELTAMALDPVGIKAIQAEIAAARKDALEEAALEIKQRGEFWSEGINHDAKIRADECQKIEAAIRARKGEGDE
jgi:hypothetical protein